MATASHPPDRPGFRPLYQQVRDLLLAQIAGGVWRPAEALPSEQALAAELGVSHGTIRKALDSLAADKLVERRQGKGTFVSEHTQESAHFRFFKIAHPGGSLVVPTCETSRLTRRAPRAGERARLRLAAGDEVFQIRRERLIEGAPRVRETIIVPASVFKGLDKRRPLPNALYTLFQSDFGVSIASAREELRAVAATREDAAALRLAAGAPLLQIDRTAFDLSGRPVELRQSRLATRDLVYVSDLR